MYRFLLLRHNVSMTLVQVGIYFGITDYNTMKVSCNMDSPMDPPNGGWVDRLIDVRTGEVVG